MLPNSFSGLIWPVLHTIQLNNYSPFNCFVPISLSVNDTSPSFYCLMQVTATDLMLTASRFFLLSI